MMGMVARGGEVVVLVNKVPDLADGRECVSNLTSALSVVGVFVCFWAR